MKTAPFFVIVLALLFSSSIMADTPGGRRQCPPAEATRIFRSMTPRSRSMELERVKRDAEKPDKKTKTNLPPPAPNFEQVKQDFESIQRLQDDIITAYSKSVVIDFKRISEDAIQMNQSASRLEENLFPLEEKKKESKKAVAAEPIAQFT